MLPNHISHVLEYDFLNEMLNGNSKVFNEFVSVINESPYLHTITLQQRLTLNFSPSRVFFKEKKERENGL